MATLAETMSASWGGDKKVAGGAVASQKSKLQKTMDKAMGLDLDPEDEKSLMDKASGALGGLAHGATRALGALRYLPATVASTVNELTDLIPGDSPGQKQATEGTTSEASFGDWWKQVKSGEGFGSYLDTGNKWADRALGLGLDVAGDPLNLVAGAGIIAKAGRAGAASTLIARGVEKGIVAGGAREAEETLLNRVGTKLAKWGPGKLSKEEHKLAEEVLGERIGGLYISAPGQRYLAGKGRIAADAAQVYIPGTRKLTGAVSKLPGLEHLGQVGNKIADAAAERGVGGATGAAKALRRSGDEALFKAGNAEVAARLMTHGDMKTWLSDAMASTHDWDFSDLGGVKEKFLAKVRERDDETIEFLRSKGVKDPERFSMNPESLADGLEKRLEVTKGMDDDVRKATAEYLTRAMYEAESWAVKGHLVRAGITSHGMTKAEKEAAEATARGVRDEVKQAVKREADDTIEAAKAPTQAAKQAAAEASEEAKALKAAIAEAERLAKTGSQRRARRQAAVGAQAKQNRRQVDDLLKRTEKDLAGVNAQLKTNAEKARAAAKGNAAQLETVAAGARAKLAALDVEIAKEEALALAHRPYGRRLGKGVAGPRRVVPAEKAVAGRLVKLHAEKERLHDLLAVADEYAAQAPASMAKAWELGSGATRTARQRLVAEQERLTTIKASLLQLQEQDPQRLEAVLAAVTPPSAATTELRARADKLARAGYALRETDPERAVELGREAKRLMAQADGAPVALTPAGRELRSLVRDADDARPFLERDAAGVADAHGLDTALDADVAAVADDLVRTSQAWARQNLPEQVEVYRAGTAHGDIFAVTTDVNVARRHMGYKGLSGEPQAMTVNRNRIQFAADAFPGDWNEAELLIGKTVPATDLERTAETLRRMHQDFNMIDEFDPLDADVALERLKQQHVEAEARLEQLAGEAMTAADVEKVLNAETRAARAQAQGTVSQMTNDEMARLNGLNQLMGDTATKFMDGEYITDPRVADALKKLQAEPMKEFAKVYGTMMKYWKTWAVMTPGFHGRNFMGIVFNNWLEGVPISAYFGFRQAQRGASADVKAGRQIADPVAAALRKHSMFRQGQTEGELGGPGDNELFSLFFGRFDKTKKLRNPASRTSRWAGSKVEAAGRGAVAYHVLRQRMAAEGGVLTDAAILEAHMAVARLHFDYDDLTPFEKKYLKKIMPFYTWTRKNIPLQLEMMVRQPRKYAMWGKVRQNLALGTEEDEVVPGYWEELLGGKTPFSLGGVPIYATPDLPYRDVFKQVTDPLRLASSLSPAISLPVQRWAGKDLGTGIPMRDDLETQTGGAAGVAKILSLPGVAQIAKLGGLNVQEDVDGNPMMSDKDTKTLNSAIPILGHLTRLFPGGDEGAFGGAKARSSQLSYLTGLGTKALDDNAIAGELYKRNKDVDEMMERLEERGVISPEQKKIWETQARKATAAKRKKSRRPKRPTQKRPTRRAS